MATEYKKIAEGVYIEKTMAPEPIYLDKLIAERDRLVQLQEQEKPTDEELFAWAKEMHPAYEEINANIEMLNSLIYKLESV
jgi:hypothetical protein